MTTAARSAIELVALMGAQGTAVALLGLVVVRAGRLSPSWQAAIWLVVLAKFVLPWGPALPWSLADLWAALRFHREADPLVSGAAIPGVAKLGSASAVWLVVAVAWLAGAGFVLGRAAIGHMRVLQAARRARSAPAHALALLASLASARPRRRPPQLVVGSADVGPHVVGVVRPIIVMPPSLLGDTRESRALLGAALLHELAHIRRWDALARVVQVVANAVFFFWPVVRLVSRRLDLAREAACDASAIDASCLSRPAYARLLVRMAQLRTAAAVSLAASRGLDARVAAVLGPPARTRLGAAHWIALLAWSTVVLGGARSAAARGEASCRYTPQLAEALRLAHPEADLDGDGVLSRDEACEFQAELRLRVDGPRGTKAGAGSRPGATAALDLVSRLGEVDENLLTEPLCCNCDRGAENSAPWISRRSDACLSDEGR